MALVTMYSKCIHTFNQQDIRLCFHAVAVCLSYLTCISVAATYTLARSSGSFV